MAIHRRNKFLDTRYGFNGSIIQKNYDADKRFLLFQICMKKRWIERFICLQFSLFKKDFYFFFQFFLTLELENYGVEEYMLVFKELKNEFIFPPLPIQTPAEKNGQEVQSRIKEK